MVHTLKTVGDLLELCKRLPEDMELREFFTKNEYLNISSNEISVDTEMCEGVRCTVEDIDEENVVLTFYSKSLDSNVFNLVEQE